MKTSREHCARPVREQHAHLHISMRCIYLSVLKSVRYGDGIVGGSLGSFLNYVCTRRVSWCDLQLPQLSVRIGARRNPSDFCQLKVIDLEICSHGCQTRNMCQLLVKQEQNNGPEVKP